MMRKSLDMIYARDQMVNAHIRLTEMSRRAIEDVDELIRQTMEAEAKEIRSELPMTEEIPERRVLKINYQISSKRVYMSSPHLPEWLPIADNDAVAEKVMLDSLREYFNKRYNHNALVFTPIETVESMFMSLERHPVVPQYMLVELYYRPLPNITTYVVDDEEVKELGSGCGE